MHDAKIPGQQIFQRFFAQSPFEYAEGLRRKEAGDVADAESRRQAYRSTRLCSEVAGGVTRLMGVRLFREPDAVTPPVRFDEREQETEPRQAGLRR